MDAQTAFLKAAFGVTYEDSLGRAISSLWKVGKELGIDMDALCSEESGGLDCSLIWHAIEARDPEEVP